MSDDVSIIAGDVWRDLDPRGGPIFRVVGFDGHSVVVTALDGSRKRRVLRNRFRASDTYRSGYTLVSRKATTS